MRRIAKYIFIIFLVNIVLSSCSWERCKAEGQILLKPVSAEIILPRQIYRIKDKQEMPEFKSAYI